MHTRFDEVFRISVILKGIDAAIEIIGGLFLLLITPSQIHSIVHWLTSSELKADPHDFISNLLVHHTGSIAANTTYGGIYLLIHGVVKGFVIINVLRNKYWAYPMLIVVLLGFIVYQLIQIAGKFSIGLTLLTAFDAFVVVMTFLEWQKVRNLRREEEESDIKPNE